MVISVGGSLPGGVGAGARTRPPPLIGGGYNPSSANDEFKPAAMSRAFYFGLLLALYFGSNIAMNMYSKWLFAGALQLPLFVTMAQQVFCFFLTLLITACPGIYKRTELKGGRSMWIQLTLVPLMFAFNIGLNNISLEHVPLSANVLIRATSPMFVAALTWMVVGTTYSWAKIVCMVGMVVGVSLAVADNPDFNLVGTLMCLTSTLGMSIWAVLVANLMGSMQKLKVFDIILYCAWPIVICLLPAVYLMGEFSKLGDYLVTKGVFEVTILVSTAGVMTWVYNIICFAFLNAVGALFQSLAGAFRVVPLLFFSVIFFRERLTYVNMSGMVIASTAFVYNSYLKIKEKKPSIEDEVASEKTKQLNPDVEALLNKLRIDSAIPPPVLSESKVD